MPTATAFHEAGHAVVATALGKKHCVGDPHLSGFTYRPYASAHIVEEAAMTMAGTMAEAMAGFDVGTVEKSVGAIKRLADFAALKALRLTAAQAKAAAELARRVLTKNAAAVRSLAQQLTETPRLGPTGAEPSKALAVSKALAGVKRDGDRVVLWVRPEATKRGAA